MRRPWKAEGKAAPTPEAGALGDGRCRPESRPAELTRLQAAPEPGHAAGPQLGCGPDVSSAPADVRIRRSQSNSREVTMLWLTGTRPARLALGPRTKLKAYIQAGGTLLVDPATGGDKFFDEAKAMLEDMFGGKLKRAEADSDILTGSFAGGVGANVTNASYTSSPGV